MRAPFGAGDRSLRRRLRRSRVAERPAACPIHFFIFLAVKGSPRRVVISEYVEASAEQMWVEVFGTTPGNLLNGGPWLTILELLS
jgi:hypothetical protein